MSTGKAFLRQIKENSICKCGEKRHLLFEFSHYSRINKYKRNGKSVDISKFKCKNKIKEELKKGRYLCVMCHREETHMENQKDKFEFITSLYEQCNLNFDTSGKICNGIICKGQYMEKKKFTHLQNKCDMCFSMERIIRKTGKQDIIKDFKIEFGHCAYCKRNCSMDSVHLFEWDHIFGKNCKVSSLVEASFETIKNEISLCRLLCLSCHRIKSIMESRNEWSDDLDIFHI